MQLKAVIGLTPGEVIAEDVLDHKGNVIIKKNTSLDKYLIQKLNVAKITCVNVKEPEDDKTTYFEKIKVSSTFKQFFEIYSKSFFELKSLMEQFLETKTPIDSDRLYEIVDNITSPFKHSKITILDMLAVLETAESDFLYTHSINVALICNYTAKWFKLEGKDLRALVLCGFYYDIGKFKIDSGILLKQGRLTNEEFDMIKSHPYLGYEMLQPFNIDERIKLAAYMHHERIDGSGYPQGIKDEQIVPFAKIIAILDSYEAMTSYRSYRAPLCPFTVIEIFEKDGYGKYDTGCYITFLEKMVEEYIGKEVQLSDGTICEVILINKQKYSRPMVKTVDGTFIDLTTRKDLSIKALV